MSEISPQRIFNIIKEAKMRVGEDFIIEVLIGIIAEVPGEPYRNDAFRKIEAALAPPPEVFMMGSTNLTIGGVMRCCALTFDSIKPDAAFKVGDVIRCLYCKDGKLQLDENGDWRAVIDAN